jgi:hypothetical protein
MVLAAQRRAPQNLFNHFDWIDLASAVRGMQRSGSHR